MWIPHSLSLSVPTFQTTLRRSSVHWKAWLRKGGPVPKVLIDIVNLFQSCSLNRLTQSRSDCWQLGGGGLECSPLHLTCSSLPNLMHDRLSQLASTTTTTSGRAPAKKQNTNCVCMTPRDKGRQLNTATLTCSRSYFGRVQKISIGRGHAIRKKTNSLCRRKIYIYFLLFFFWWRVSWFDDVWPAALSADLSLQSLSWKWTCVTFDIFAETKCSAREKSACQTRAIFLSETVEKRREIDGRWLSPGEKKKNKKARGELCARSFAPPTISFFVNNLKPGQRQPTRRIAYLAKNLLLLLLSFIWRDWRLWMRCRRLSENHLGSLFRHCLFAVSFFLFLLSVPPSLCLVESGDDPPSWRLVISTSL